MITMKKQNYDRNTMYSCNKKMEKLLYYSYEIFDNAREGRR